ncbi:chorismate lyase [Pseudomonas luteola]|uniref:chorismate--pyruvate lyase family protein n=1 Tax=Pseudomonas luteola TaxID=47886 RepID=UPI00388DAD04
MTPRIPFWQNAAQLDGDAPRKWLFEDEGSLTQRLTQLSGNRFAVDVITEGWQPLRADECKALDAPSETLGWVREVFLLGTQTRWVFARSVATREALEASGFELAQLGQRPLGALLFSDNAFSRDPLEATHYPADWLPLEEAQDSLWARRSVFRRDGLGVLVAEVFLPAFWQFLKDQRL